MLYIFHVINGSMITLDMGIALKKVEILKEAIQKETETPIEKQVLLVSGGEALENHQDVSHYTAGTDTNPIYFFSIAVIESEQLPKLLLDLPQDAEVVEQIEESKLLPPNQNTVSSRAQLAKKVFEYSRDQMNYCEKIVHYQHLQQQGWAAAVANLEDILVVIQKQYKNFEISFQEHMKLRDHRLELIDHFPEDLKLLGKIPLLPALSSSSCCNIGVISDHIIPMDELSNSSHCERLLSSTIRNLTLLDWILPKGIEDLEGPLEEYKTRLYKLNPCLMTTLNLEYTTILNEASKPEFKEIGGLEHRLFGLQELLIDGQNWAIEQKNFADSFIHNQTRSMSVRDDSIYPSLCNSQVTNLEMMLQTYEKIRDIRKRCMKARSELSVNIVCRLKWILFVEKKVSELTGQLYIWSENMKKIESQLGVYEQVHTCPELYFKSVAEVIRRQNFNKNFLRWADQLSYENRDIWYNEVTIREEFMELISSHFVKDLFPGLNDIPPAFATQAPDRFDDELPQLTLDNLIQINESVPEICSSININELDGIPPLLHEPIQKIKCHGGKEDFSFSKDTKNAASTDLFTSAVCSTTLHKASSLGNKNYDDPASPDHFIVSRPTSLIRDHPESETDTEEFEKVCGSISDGTYSPMEPDRNISLNKLRSRSSQDNNPSPAGDQLQSPPSHPFQEFVNVNCRKHDSEPTSQLIFEDLTYNELVEALRIEVHRLKNENISSDLSIIISNLQLIINKFNEVKLQTVDENSDKKTQEILELNAKLCDVQDEVNIYQNEIQRLQANMQQMTMEFNDDKLRLDLEHKDTVKKMLLEQELEDEATTLKWHAEVIEKTEELSSSTQKLLNLENELKNIKEERDSLAQKLIKLESSYGEKEREAEENMVLLKNLKTEKERKEDLFQETLDRSLLELRTQLERDFSENRTKKLLELEEEYKEDLRKCRELWEAQKEEEVEEKMAQLEGRLTSAHEVELDNAKLQYKMEIEGLRSRFRMMTMDKSPSETSLEKIEKGEFIDISNHEATVRKLREELLREKEVALDVTRKSLEEAHQVALKEEKQRNDEKRKLMEAQRQEEFSAAVNVVTQDKERVIENLRLKVEFLTEENEKLRRHASLVQASDNLVQMDPCEIHKKQIDHLEKEIHRLKRISFITERHSDLSFSFSDSSSTTTTIASATSALEQQPSSPSNLADVAKTLQIENNDLRQALMHRNSDHPPKISVYTCQPNDYVLIVWDETYSHYRVLLEGHSYLHFVNDNYLKNLGLSLDKPNKLFCLAEVMKKEFCQAKKEGNRYKLPIGTKFYRVVANSIRPSYPQQEGEKDDVRHRKPSVVCPPAELRFDSRASESGSISRASESGSLQPPASLAAADHSSEPSLLRVAGANVEVTAVTGAVSSTSSVSPSSHRRSGFEGPT